MLCHYCGAAEATTSDHIVPRSRGGADAKYNRVPACQPCNQAKADAMPTCECITCRAALNMPRRKPKSYKARRPDIHTLSGYLRYPAMPDDLR